ncbi:MAG: addiction module antidote protein, HigA family [Chloroflexi bacterium]|nr:MAG: addiction module antidote protein, HigA family [Chloroflexota bacterium]
MPSTRTRRIESDLLVHPGELLAEELEVREMTQRELAEAMGRPVQVINEIVRGKKAITAETAVQLEAALKIPAHLWLNMQSSYELKLARLAQRERGVA